MELNGFSMNYRKIPVEEYYFESVILELFNLSKSLVQY